MFLEMTKEIESLILYILTNELSGYRVGREVALLFSFMAVFSWTEV